MKLKNVMISCAILAGLSISSGAIAQQKPDITPYTFENGANLNGLSDNGKWPLPEHVRKTQSWIPILI